MRKLLQFAFFFPLFSVWASAQTNDALRYFPKGTRLYSNIAYANDTLERHQLDIYLPADARRMHPIIFWIHSGGWRAGGKQADMHYLPHTVHALIKSGYAIVALNYRYSTMAIFPAQIKDCNQALEFVCENAAKYELDPERIALIGFSAGGHLAALMGLSANSSEADFYVDGKKPGFKVRAVIDYYGLSDFYLKPPAEFEKTTNGPGLLFGAAMRDKPSLVTQATPLTYIDSNDPPFLIIHGNKDEEMDVRQSIRLNDTLKSHGVATQLIIIDGAPHGGEMFDTKRIRRAVVAFLDRYLQYRP